MEFEKIYTDAEAALRRSDTAGAEHALTQQWPNLAGAPAEALHLMGLVRLAQLKGEEAAEFVRAAVRADPSALRHHVFLGHILSADQRYGEAADVYAAALQIDPNWPGLQYTYANAAYRAGRFADAEAVARQLSANSSDANVWTLFSSALREQGKAKDALAAAERALILDPNLGGAQFSLAAALLANDRAQDSLRELDKLAARGIEAGAMQLTRARALEKLGRRDEAKAAFALAAERWPTDPAVRRALDAKH
jgi:protein O-GlcNAc transferase